MRSTALFSNSIIFEMQSSKVLPIGWLACRCLMRVLYPLVVLWVYMYMLQKVKLLKVWVWVWYV